MMSSGDLSKDIGEILKPSREKKCILGKYFTDLSDDDSTSLEILLNSTVSNSKISDLLNRHGFTIGETAIWKHRAGSCACVRPQ
jgi:hypothetical protein